MRLEIPETESKSDGEPHELNFTLSCFYFINI